MGQLRKKKELGNPSRTVPGAAESRFTLNRFYRWDRLLLWFIIAIFAKYYYWTIHPDPSQPIPKFGLYCMVADAIAQGQANLLVRPRPELLALPNPYDPVQNVRYRMHDVSLYKSRYYVYFGVAPAVVLYLPYRLLTGEVLSDREGAWLFASGAYALACLLLNLLWNRWWPLAPRWLLLFLCVCLGFSNTFPFLLRRPAVYECAIAAGQFFMFLALYAAARAAFGCKYPRLMAALSGVALAAAFGSRPFLVLSGIVLCLLLVRGGVLPPFSQRRRQLVCALLPFAAGTLLLLVYNYVRFDSPLEFGTSYMLSATNSQTTRLFDLSRLLPNLRFTLLEPPGLRSTLPFIVAPRNPAFFLSHNIVWFDYIAGIVWTLPLILAFGAAPSLWKRVSSERRLEWAACVGTLGLLGAIWACLDAMVMATMRYQADYSMVWFLAVALILGGVSEWPVLRQRVWMYRGIVLFGLLGILVNAAIGIQGYNDNFRFEAPKQYESLASWFRPVAKVLVSLGVPDERTGR
jgi:hypothetical protein